MSVSAGEAARMADREETKILLCPRRQRGGNCATTRKDADYTRRCQLAQKVVRGKNAVVIDKYNNVTGAVPSRLRGALL